MPPEIPLPLRQALESGQCVLFCGAGIGYNVTGPDGIRAPTGNELAQEIAKEFDIDAGDKPDLAQGSQIF